jgi:hypothetical protein
MTAHLWKHLFQGGLFLLMRFPIRVVLVCQEAQVSRCEYRWYQTREAAHIHVQLFLMM